MGMSDGEKVRLNFSVGVSVLINPVGKSVLICSDGVGDSVGMSDGEKVELNGLGLGASVGVSDGEKVGKSVDTCTGPDIRWLVVITVMLMTVRFVQPPSVTLFNVYRKFLKNADDSAVSLVMPLTLCE